MKFKVTEGQLTSGEFVILEKGDVVEIDNIPETVGYEVFYAMYKDEYGIPRCIYSSNLLYDEENNEHYDDYDNGKIALFQFDANEDKDPQWIYYWINQEKGSVTDLHELILKNNQGGIVKLAKIMTQHIEVQGEKVEVLEVVQVDAENDASLVTTVDQTQWVDSKEIKTDE